MALLSYMGSSLTVKSMFVYTTIFLAGRSASVRVDRVPTHPFLKLRPFVTSLMTRGAGSACAGYAKNVLMGTVL